MPRVVHFEINAEDMIRAKKFYEERVRLEDREMGRIHGVLEHNYREAR